MKFLSTIVVFSFIASSLHAADCEIKIHEEQRIVTTPRQKTLTPIPKLMKTIIGLQKALEKGDQINPSTLHIMGIENPISKDELLTLLVTAKSAFPQLAAHKSTAPYMQKCEKFISDLDSVVKIQGGLDSIVKVLLTGNTLVNDLPQFLNNSLEQSGSPEAFIKLMFSSCMPDDEQGKAAKAETMLEVASKPELVQKSDSLPKQHKKQCIIL